jgi:DNA-binding transcriptional regulator YiaG
MSANVIAKPRALTGDHDHRPHRPEVSTSNFPRSPAHGTVDVMPRLAARPPLTPYTLRQCREILQMTQIAFADQLGVSLETCRRWDADRRTPRHEILVMANALALRRNPLALLQLGTLARLVGVHVRTLHAAAKDGRLRVTYDTRTTFRRLRTRATLADAEHFKREYFDKAMWPVERPAQVTWETIPPARRWCTSGNQESAVPRPSFGSASNSCVRRAVLGKHCATRQD